MQRRLLRSVLRSVRSHAQRCGQTNGSPPSQGGWQLLQGPGALKAEEFCSSLLRSALPSAGPLGRQLLSEGALLRARTWESIAEQNTRLRRELCDAVSAVRKAQRAALREVAKKRAEWEFKAVALLNSITVSAPGQDVLRFGIPVASILALRSPAVMCLQRNWTTASGAGPSATVARHPIVAPAPLSLLDKVLEELATVLRALYLSILFAPAILTAPVCLHFGLGREWWYRLVLWTLERSGPAFIKWGQWGATRPDLFPADLCLTLEKLHNDAPVHKAEYSRQAVQQAFSLPVDVIFDEFDDKPVASGSIAQIHRGVLSHLGAAWTGCSPGTVVAVKVRHPGVTDLAKRDFKLMMRTFAMSENVPGLSELRLQESVRQFGGPLHEQLDLGQEAKNLEKFNRNFKWWSRIGFPEPLHPLVAPSVLVETFEDGNLISGYVHKPAGKDSISIANLGLNMYLKMLIRDNFVHADLHPGNILVRHQENSSWMSWWRQRLGYHTNLVLLDAGMVTELSRNDQQGVVGFFQALTDLNGMKVAENMLALSHEPHCQGRDPFIKSMKELFDSVDSDTIREHTADVMREMLNRVRRYGVTLKGSVSSLVATTLVLEGWSTKLDPDIRIIEQMREVLPGGSQRRTKALDKIIGLGSMDEL